MTGLRTLIIGALGVVLIGASTGSVRRCLVWNLSASVPIGPYVIDAGVPKLDDYVLILLPVSLAELASERGYLPAGVALLKQVSAAQDDRVCRVGPQILVNGIARARAAATDLLGRPMPAWTGCQHLHAGEVFLLGGGPDSFDSRYFGPAPSSGGRRRSQHGSSSATAFGDGCRHRRFELSTPLTRRISLNKINNRLRQRQFSSGVNATPDVKTVRSFQGWHSVRAGPTQRPNVVRRAGLYRSGEVACATKPPVKNRRLGPCGLRSLPREAVATS